MQSENETVIIYQTWFENAAKLGEEKQSKVIMQIIRYGLYGDVPDNSDDICADLLFSDWSPLVDATKRKKKGGAPKGNKNAAGNKGGTGRPKKDNPKTQPININSNANADKKANSNTTALPAGGASAIEGAEDTPLVEPDWLRSDDDDA